MHSILCRCPVLYCILRGCNVGFELLFGYYCYKLYLSGSTPLSSLLIPLRELFVLFPLTIHLPVFKSMKFRGEEEKRSCWCESQTRQANCKVGSYSIPSSSAAHSSSRTIKLRVWSVSHIFPQDRPHTKKYRIYYCITHNVVIILLPLPPAPLYCL